jgi:hypothetical protein
MLWRCAEVGEKAIKPLSKIRKSPGAVWIFAAVVK